MAIAAPAFPQETPHQRLTKRLGGLKADRATYDAHYKEIVRHFAPRRGKWLDDGKPNGSKKNQEIIDPAPLLALRTLASGMMAGSTNPAQPWFRLATPDPEMMEFPAVARWLYQVENLMRDVFARSNVYDVLPSLYAEAGAFGTGLMVVYRDDDKVIRCEANTVGSYYLAQDANGRIDTRFKELKMQVRHMVAEFEWDNLSPAVQSAAQNGQWEQWVTVLHAIEPRRDTKWGRADSANMDFASIYIDPNNSEKVLRDSGFDDNPLCCFRWDVNAEDAYGSSPAMDALGTTKALQIQQKRKAQAIDKHLSPPMVATPGQENRKSSVLAGDVTYAGFSPNGTAPLFQPAYTVTPQTKDLNEDIQQLQFQIARVMYTDVFQPISMLDRRQITAEEIIKRAGENLLMLGPVIGNHKTGVINVLIDRTFNIMAADGLLPPPPQELEAVALKVEMISPLAQAQKMVSLSSMERFVGFAGQLALAQANAQQQVTAFDKLDVDQTLDEYAIASGVPPTIVVSDEDIAAMREQRAKQQEAQAMAAAAPAAKDMASAAQTMSETQVDGKSALDRAAGVAG